MTPQAFTQMFNAHHGAVLAYCLRRVDPATARDVAAETFAIAWRRLETTPQMPLPWLLAVARRVLIAEHRRRQREDRLSQRVATDRSHSLAPSQAGVEQNAHADVGAALALLNPDDQEILRLVGWEELDHHSAATVLGCSPGALRVRLHRARRRLRAAMARSSAETDEPAPGAAGGHSVREGQKPARSARPPTQATTAPTFLATAPAHEGAGDRRGSAAHPLQHGLTHPPAVTGPAQTTTNPTYEPRHSMWQRSK